MAIAFDTKTAFTFNAAATNITYSHTVTGSDTILWVGVSILATATIGAVTYNGTSMTQFGGGSVGTAAIKDYLFYLIAPTTGTNTVSVSQNTSTQITSCSASYTGVAQTGQPDATSLGGPTTTASYSQSVTSVADNCFAILYGNASSGSAITAGTNTTVRNQPEVSFCGAYMVDSAAAQTPAGTFTLAFTSASQSVAGCMASFKPIASAVANTNFLSFMPM